MTPKETVGTRENLIPYLGYHVMSYNISNLPEHPLVSNY
jgi:hypothetical protein